MIKHYTCERLTVSIFETRKEMGAAAAAAGILAIGRALEKAEHISVMFAAAPSQAELLDGLIASDVDWSRVDAYHMDDYIGLPAEDGRRFPNFLRARLFQWLPLRSINCMRPSNTRLEGEAEAARYEGLLRNNPIDVCFMGVGENGHIAFNDPHVADFNDPRWVKTVCLDRACRMQQVNDGCFAHLDEVPDYAITVTIPALFASGEIICSVPSHTKAQAVRRLLTGPVSPECPASILVGHPAAGLYLDRDAAELVL